jgi:FAD/FMN-containing dehydrogenase
VVVDKKSLVDIFSEENVYDDEEALKEYTQDQSFATGSKPDFVVFAENTEQVQQVVRLANKTRTALIPYSSGLNFHGAALTSGGGIIVNLSHMKKILQVDEQNWSAMIEPGVTYEQLQGELMKRGFRLMIPFGAAPGRSVLTSYLERDPAMAATTFEYGNPPIMDTELVLPDGELLRTGLWSAGGDPGGVYGPIRNLILRLWTGAQGTLGIMIKMCVQIMPFIQERKIYFLCFNELSEVVEAIRMIQRREIGTECFLLNRFNLAALLNKEWGVPKTFPAAPTPSENFEQLKTALPAWVLSICIHGGPRNPEEKIAYEEEALQEVCSSLNIEAVEALAGVDGLD